MDPNAILNSCTCIHTDMYTVCPLKLPMSLQNRKSPLKEDNLSTKDKMAGPEGVLIKRFH